MGLFDFFGNGTTPNATNDTDRGYQAMVYFNNEMINQYGSSYSLTADQAAARIMGDDPKKAQILFDGLGTAINAIPMKEYQVQSAMVALADQSQGKLPANQTVFFKALSDRMQDITATDWIEATPQIAAQTAVQVVQGAQAIGDSVIATGKTLTMIAPLAITAAVLFIGWSYTKRAAGA